MIATPHFVVAAYYIQHLYLIKIDILEQYVHMERMIKRLNYHHLHYFWCVAKVGKLTEAAGILNVSQSALSAQIRQLEDMLEQALFLRVGRRLELTEAGRIAFSYAEDIFQRGEELTGLLSKGTLPARYQVRIGAVSTLSRNFQEAFIAPLMDRSDVRLVLHAGRLEDLLTELGTHALDLVLSNVKVRGDDKNPWLCQRIARQEVCIVGKPRTGKPFRLPQDLYDASLLLPGRNSDVRSAFDVLCDRWQLRPNIRAEVDDMAMLRLLVRDSDAIGVLPTVVVRDEISSGQLQEYAVLPGVYENFYAISAKRHFEENLLKQLLARTAEEVLDTFSAHKDPGQARPS